MGTRDERVLDFFWIGQAVGQPTEAGQCRYDDGRILYRDALAVFNPRHAFTENLYEIDTVVPATLSMIAHDFEIADGVEITVESGGELLVL